MVRARTFRWALFPLAAVGSCTATGIAAGGIRDWFTRHLGEAALEAALPFDAQAAVGLALRAFAFVMAGALMAPRARLLIAPALFAAGAWLAWDVLGTWYFPESHPRAYEPSLLPLWGCWAGGVAAVALTALPSVRRALTTVSADARSG